ncbi:hypothetical protein ACFVVL_34530 [Kitasatospora sp. NPDC058115]|uniref:hypothetical protein n=1 Tax=Kitasatospora sp. NPDC058115 TaxID=3346347 RepID=UPI0036DF3F9C
MSASDSFEDDLLRAMTRTGEAFHPQGPAGLAAGGLARGRRRWRRRSALAAVGGAAALTLVGAGAVYLTGGSPAASGPAPAASGSAPDSGAPAPGPSTAAPSAASGAAAVGGEELLAAFRAMLPEGQVGEAEASGTGDDGRPGGGGSPGASLVLDDGRGKAMITVSVARVAGNDPRRADSGCPDRKLVPYDACTTTPLPGGGALTLFQGYEQPRPRGDTKWWSARLTGEDGRLIELSEWNAPQRKGVPVSRATPPLSPEQLRAVVTDGFWDRVVAALAEPYGPDGTGGPYGGQEILATVAELLPAGLKRSEADGGDAFASLVVNDGRGRSLVELNVDDWSGPRHTEPFGGSETTPDGTQVKFRKQPGNPVKWTAEALHPDGLRVAVSAYSSGAQGAASTRTAPALTVEQLKAIAASPEWKLKR